MYAAPFGEPAFCYARRRVNYAARMAVDVLTLRNRGEPPGGRRIDAPPDRLEGILEAGAGTR